MLCRCPQDVAYPFLLIQAWQDQHMPQYEQNLSSLYHLMPHFDQYLSRPFRVFSSDPLWPKAPFTGFPLSLSIFTLFIFHFHSSSFFFLNFTVLQYSDKL